jgi:hypothetical protein
VSVVQLSDWSGVIRNRPDRAELVLKAPLRQSSAGGAGAFLGKASDGEQYWIKVPNGPQGDRVPITEQIVGRAGGIIGACTCGVRSIEIPDSLDGWEFRAGHTLQECIAHASSAVFQGVEPPKAQCLGDRGKDDNAARHVTYFALYDWCWGGDVQGLLDISDDRRFYSHDHGWFLPPEGRSWNVAELEAKVDEPHELPTDGAGLDFLAVAATAGQLEKVTRSDLEGMLEKIPRDWPVSNDELEAVGFFLERRAPAVAERLRSRFGGGP